MDGSAMSAPHGSKTNSPLASADTPESASDRRRVKRIRHHQQTRRDLRDARQQLRECARLLSVTRPASV
jgi:hypothetical protein